MIRYDYDYDLINHPYLSELIDEDSGPTTQSFVIPDGVRFLTGVKVKLSKCGNPGPVHYAIGRSVGGGEIAEGTIPASVVLPVFELMVGEDFAPVGVEEGETCYLTLTVAKGKKPLDAYRLYGPNTRQDTGGPESFIRPHWWGEWEGLPEDYQGANYPDYEGGHRYRADGTETWSMSFAILTDLDTDPCDGEEQRFEFVRELVAPPFSEWRPLTDQVVKHEEGTLVLDDGWGLTAQGSDSPIMRNGAHEIRAFVSRVMGIELGDESAPRQVLLRVTHDESIPAGGESFTLRAEEAGISITAREPRGILRAVHWLEDEMLARRAPALERGFYRIRFNYGLRMTPGIYPAPSYHQLQGAQIWTPGHMWRLARAGYNAIYMQANVEELVEDSAIFPEMNDPGAAAAIERLRRMTELGSQYGVDVYVDLKTGYYKRFNEAVYERLPELRSHERFGGYPCSGQQVVLDFYRETVRHLFEKANQLKGLVIIYDTEGFYSCFNNNRQGECHHCKDYAVEELSSRLFGAIKDGMQESRKDAELILWTYYCDEPWNYRVIDAMPSDVTLMACYSQFKELNRFGVKVRTDDYSLCSAEPSEYFLKVRSLARKKGLKLICKTEDTYGQEFVSTPYTPCLELHQQRWIGVAEQDVAGYLAAYIHIGFMPGPCADLTRLNAVAVERNGEPVSHSLDEKLWRVATLRYGAAASRHVVKAWKAYSQAMRDYFPYSPGVCRYPGPLQSSPAQPFYLDPKRPMPRLRSRGYVADLKWTELPERLQVDGSEGWNASLISRCFQAFSRRYREGNLHLELAQQACPAEYREPLAKALNVSRAQYLQVKSLLHYVQFLQLRDAYLDKTDRVLLEALIFVCESELSDATEALDLCRRDSRIGFSCEGAGNVRGGLFTPMAIQQKVASLRQTLVELYSRLEGLRDRA